MSEAGVKEEARVRLQSRHWFGKTVAGAVLGIGLARGIGALNLGVIGRIFMSWVVTLPAGAILAIIFFTILQAIFV